MIKGLTRLGSSQRLLSLLHAGSDTWAVVFVLSILLILSMASSFQSGLRFVSLLGYNLLIYAQRRS